MQLLIMAAGMGSRFGGLKQIEPFGPNGEFIIDYSIYDAIQAGFSKVVFIIKEENYQLFKETIGSRVEPHIPVEYVFQKMTNIPDFVKIPEGRTKPWGTAHAIYCAKDALTEPFLVINADDFYGRDAFITAKKFLDTQKTKEYAVIAYEVANTMTQNGSVKRGVLTTNNDQLTSITESSISYDNDQIIAKPLNKEETYKISANTLVSMNMLAFDLSLFDYIALKMREYFQNADLMNSEFLIPDVLDAANKTGFAHVLVLKTNSTWYGVTYQEDKDYVKTAIQKLIADGVYPNNLWQ